MALANWLITKSNPGIDVQVDTAIPLHGTGSLRISQDNIAATTAVANAHLRPLAGPPQSQFVKGKVRTLIQPKMFTDNATSISFMGILGMMSQANVFATGGKGYFAGRWGGVSPSWWIARVDHGVTSAADFFSLRTGNTTHLPSFNDVRAIEFEWIYDSLEFGGVRLTFSVSANADFSNLTQIYQVIDNSASSLTTSSGEGVFFSALHTTAGPIVDVLYDRTTIFELVEINA